MLKDTGRMEYVRAKECLCPFNLSLDSAASEFAQALSILKGNGSVLEAVRYYASTHAADILPIRTQTLVEDLLKTRAASHVSARHLCDLRARLRRFAKAFQCDVHTIRPAQVQDFLLSLKLSPRSINNFRGAISNLLTRPWERIQFASGQFALGLGVRVGVYPRRYSTARATTPQGK
ncbi:MAG: hypothetical protein KGS61_14920, partial [Verrucomicrobia bacterium]|nr:hypothetical protein [Verrucomicrobiota bacterium]